MSDVKKMKRAIFTIFATLLLAIAIAGQSNSSFVIIVSNCADVSTYSASRPIIFCTADQRFYIHNGSSWVSYPPSAVDSVNGQTGTVTLTKSSVGLAAVDNTSDAAKPISTATQAALDAKQATLVSTSNIKSINGASILGSGDLTVTGSGSLGYTIAVQALTSSPADGATVYFGMLPKAPVTAAGTSKVFIRKAGTIKIAEIYCFSGTAGTAESWSISIRRNNTTDTLIATVAAATSERIFSNTGLNIPVVVGDYFEIKSVNPTWATNPATTIFGGYVYIE
jgi:hypothetical protein